VRDLRKAMDDARVAAGALLAAGRFSQEAYGVKDAGIELVDGAGLLERIAALPEEKSLGLLEFVTEGDFRTPTCPLCQIKMVPRRSTVQGRAFWGCPNYPACKQTFPVNPNLPPA
jgi:restriction system protein